MVISLAILALAATSATAQRPMTEAPPTIDRAGEDGAAPPVVDQVPKGAVARLGSVRFRSTQPLSRVVFSPDGKHIVVGGGDGRVSYWDAATGQVEFSFPFAGGTITRLTFSPDGAYLAVAGQAGFVGVFEAATRKRTMLTTSVNGEYRPRAIAWRDAKSLVVAEPSGVLRVLDAVTGQEQTSFRTELANIYSIACSPDGKQVVAISGNPRRVSAEGFSDRMRAWTIDDGKPSITFSLPQMPAAGTGRVPGAPPPPIPPTFSPTVHMVWSADGKYIVAGTFDRLTPVWDAKTGKVAHQFPTSMYGGSVAFFPNGRFLATAETTGRIRIFGMMSAAELRTIELPRDPTADLAISPDGSLIATVGPDSTIRVLEINTGRERSAVNGHKGAIAGLAFLADGRLVSAGLDQTLIVWEMPGGKELGHANHAEHRVTSMAPSVDGKGVVFSGAVQHAMAWSPGTSEPRRLTSKAIGGYAPTLAPDGRTLVYADGQSIRIHDLETGKERPRLESGRNFYNSAHLVASPLGRYIAATASHGEHLISVWNAANPRPHITLAYDKPFSTTRLAFSPDARLLAAAGNNNELAVWEAATGVLRLRAQSANGALISALGFTPDNSALIVGTANGAIYLCDLYGGAGTEPVTGHLGEVRALAVSGDGKYLATGGADTTTVIWKLPELMNRVPRIPAPTATLAEQLDLAWSGLGSNDPTRAGAAIWWLTTHPNEALTLFKQRLQAVKAPDKEKIERWLKELDDERFAVRERANRGLLNTGEDAKQFIEAALTQNPSVEAKRRLEQLLRSLTTGVPSRKLQPLRAIALLEKIDSPDVKPLLQELAKQSTDEDVKHEIEWVLSRKK